MLNKWYIFQLIVYHLTNFNSFYIKSMKERNENIRKVEDLEDGSTVYEIGNKELEETPATKPSFYKNLAANLEKSARNKIANHLIEAIEEDIEARREWMEAVEKVKEFLGFTIEDLNDIPFERATRTFDTTLASSLMRFYATVRAELLPATGPAGFQINAEKTEELEALGGKRRDYLNYYLTVKDTAYYADFEQFLLYLGLYGSGFKKVYYDNVLKRPISRFIHPKDFIVNCDCSSILEADRLTHVLHLSKRDILFNQKNKVYLDADLPYLKSNVSTGDADDDDDVYSTSDVDVNVYTRKSLFPVYEVHAYLNLDELIESSANGNDSKAIPLPYIITIDKTSKEMLSLRRNWNEKDEQKKRINYFIQYNYLPGFGIWGLGLAHILGSNAITLTQLLRQLVDAGKFKNLPGGFRVKGFKQQQNDIIVGPGQFPEVDTGGVPLKEAFMPLPYGEPSQVLRELRMEIVSQCKELGSISDMEMSNSKEDIPVGTTIALLDNHNKLQSSVLRSIHMSLSRELLLLDELLQSALDSEEFISNNATQTITKDDFVKEITIIPVSDPSMNSTMHRVMRAESVMKMAMQAPELHNLREVFKLNYETQGLDPETIEDILKPDLTSAEIPPLDPISENMNILKGQP